jgi:hypothetical protein
LKKTLVCQGSPPRNGYYYRLLKKNTCSSSLPAAKTERDALTLDLFVMVNHCPTLKVQNFGKNISVPRLSIEKWSLLRFSEKNLSSFSSPATRTECGARLLDLFVVFDVCPFKKGWNLRFFFYQVWNKTDLRKLGKEISEIPTLTDQNFQLTDLYASKSSFVAKNRIPPYHRKGEAGIVDNSNAFIIGLVEQSTNRYIQSGMLIPRRWKKHSLKFDHL